MNRYVITLLLLTLCVFPAAYGQPTGASSGLDLVLAKTGPISAAPGDTIAYSLTVSNRGGVDATRVNLVEVVPDHATFNAAASHVDWGCPDGPAAGATCTLVVGHVPPGGSATVVFAVDLDDPVPAGVTTVTNTATTFDDGATGPDLNPADNTASFTTSLGVGDGGTDLAIAKAGPSSTAPGASLVYGLTVTNEGDETAFAVTLAETVPAHTTFDAGASEAGWSCPDGSPAGTACSLTLGNLAAGSAATVAFAVDVAPTLPAGVTAIVNAAAVTHESRELDPADNETSLSTPIGSAGGPDLRLTKSGPPSARPGDVLAYTLLVENLGSRDATRVLLSETVPDHTTFAAAASDAGWSCPDGAPAGTPCTFSVGKGHVPAGGSVTVDFAVRVVHPLPAGVTAILNAASVSDDGAGGADQDPTDNSDSITTPISADTGPDLALEKSGPASTSVGATIVYALTVTNDGNQDAGGVSIDEVVPRHTVFVAAASDPGWSCQDGDGAGMICGFLAGQVAVGGSATVLFAVRVLDPVPSIHNSAIVEHHGRGGEEQDPADNAAQLEVPVEPPVSGVDLDLRKVGPALTSPGELVSYRLVVSNLGSLAAAGVALTETVPDHTTFNAASSAPGWSCPGGAPAGTACAFTVPALAPGESATIAFAVTVDRPVPLSVTSIDNAATLAHPDDTNPGNDSAFLSTALSHLPSGPDVAISKQLLDPPVAGTTVKYFITVMNLGDVAATVTVYERPSYPPASFVSEYGWTCEDESECTQQVNIEPGVTVILDFFVDIPAGAVDPLVNEASAPLPGDGNPINNTVLTHDDVISIQAIPTISALGVVLLAGFLAISAFLALRSGASLR